MTGEALSAIVIVSMKEYRDVPLEQSLRRVTLLFGGAFWTVS